MRTGSVLGAYRVVKELGAGGMGSVWLAEHTILGRKAALKVLHPEMSEREDVVRRFFNEARAATTIPDPGIVQIFDFGYHSDGSAYIVMELLEGEVLEKRISRGALDVEEALRLMRQIASTLGAAHERGIVHRDLKPDNIFIVKDPEVASGERAKILDFGIAKLADERKSPRADLRASAPGSTGMIGTPLYMSPEQFDGKNVDARSDVYALGCVLYQMLTGSPPFDSSSMLMLVEMHQGAPIPLPSRSVPGLPHIVDDIVQRCLAKHATDRYASGSELASALTEAAMRPPSSPHAPGASTQDLSRVTLPPRRASAPTFSALDDAPTTAAHSYDAQAARTSSGRAPAAAKITTLSRAVATVAHVASARPWGLVTVGLTSAVGAIMVMWAVTRTSTPDPTTEVTEMEGAPIVMTVASEPAPPTPPIEAADAEPAAAEPDAAAGLSRSAEAPEQPVASDIVEVLTRFRAWAQDHAGAPCPSLAELGAPSTDRWGQALVLTCVDQPKDQQIGVMSNGPDLVAGTRDDVVSWRLDAEVTELVRGARWESAKPRPPSARPRHVVKKPPPPPTTPTPKVTKPPPASTIQLDANGIPIHR
jgi:eukaryotic-like serine/threonine-protein kinase